jgi:serine/threonine-protein kinase
VKLADFGISKECLRADELARTFIGHPCFIPPELFIAGYSSTQSDIYQLGLVLLTLLIGKYPIPMNATLRDTQIAIESGLPRQIAESLIPQHGKLAEIISVMLRRREIWRYWTAAAAYQDLSAEMNRLNQQVHWLQGLAARSRAKFPGAG